MLKQYEWAILQVGTLPLRPDRRVTPWTEHRPTVTLLWPEGERPTPANTLLADPYFTDQGYSHAETVLREIGASFADIGCMFITHDHFDHVLRLPERAPQPVFDLFDLREPDSFPNVTVENLPGHAPHLRGLAFTSWRGKRVWIVADAILDEDWLRAWGYYWPNRYSPDEIVQTWRSAAAALADADVIVPGHGSPVRVTSDLLRALAADFPARAEHADRCPDVLYRLQARLGTLP